MTITIPVVSASGAQSTVTVPDPVVTSSGVLNLPRVEWEGGPNYWKQFAKPDAAGWDDPSFFMIGIMPCPFDAQEQIAWDKDHGINTYVGGLHQWTTWKMLGTNNMYYVGEHVNSIYDGQMPADYPNLVGYLLDDETDGRYQPAEGFAFLQGKVDQLRARNDGRFLNNNYTQLCNLTSWPYGPQYVNKYQDAVCMDMYWYTIPDASFSHGTAGEYVCGPITKPRSASAYGAMVRGLRIQDAKDSKRQPVWFYIELLSGSPGEQFVRDIAPNELKGAAMSAIIAEARGLVWFNNVASESKAVGNVLRSAQYDTNFRGKTQVAAMKVVNQQIKRLAPVLNTQSYVWSFGTGLDTMLKTHAGYAYVFAMCSNNSTPGSRTFTLPTGVRGTSVEVVDENRTLAVSAGKFTDTFAAEYSYHIYKVAL